MYKHSTDTTGLLKKYRQLATVTACAMNLCKPPSRRGGLACPPEHASCLHEPNRLRHLVLVSINWMNV